MDFFDTICYNSEIKMIGELVMELSCKQNNIQKVRLAWLDIMKGIGIILVVMGHVYSNKMIFNWLYSFHMPLFFIAAGWLYKKKEISVDVKRRLKTIIIPYYAFGLLILLYWQFFERRFRDSDLSFVRSLRGLLLGQYSYLDFNVHLWFLPCFFVIVVLYNILFNFGGKKAVCITSIVFSIIYIFVPMSEMPFGFNRVFKYIGFYFLGNILSEIKLDKLILKQGKVIKLVLFAMLMGANFLLSYFGLVKGIMWYITATLGVGAIIVISLIINHNKYLQFFGQISLVVLCIHGPVYRVIIKIASIVTHMSAGNIRGNFIAVCVIVAVTMLICCIVYNLLDKVAPIMLGKSKKEQKLIKAE